jgi:DNA repair protein RadC
MNKMYPGFSELPEEMLPLHRLYHEGADHLSDPELMSIVIGTGVSEERALYMSNDILRAFDLNSIGSASIPQLCKIPNITKLKASVISAMCELSRRHAYSADNYTPVRISSPEAAYEYLYPLLRDEKVEHFVALLLDTKNNLIKKVMVSKGSLNANIVHPREVFKPAILEGADSIIVAHNHPSGDPGPSQSDIDITRKLVETSKVVGIDLHDHVIIGHGRYISLKEENLMG